MDDNSVWLGISYGVSAVTAVLEFPDSRSAALTFDGDTRLPAGVAVIDNGAIHAGVKAVQLGADCADLYLGEPGRHLGAAVPVRVGEHDKTPVERVTATLRLIWDEAVRTADGRSISDVVIAVPSSLGAHGVDLASAAVRAGLLGCGGGCRVGRRGGVDGPTGAGVGCV
jgi:hypothetical protein